MRAISTTQVPRIGDAGCDSRAQETPSKVKRHSVKLSKIDLKLFMIELEFDRKTLFGKIKTKILFLLTIALQFCEQLSCRLQKIQNKILLDAYAHGFII